MRRDAARRIQLVVRRDVEHKRRERDLEPALQQLHHIGAGRGRVEDVHVEGGGGLVGEEAGEGGVLEFAGVAGAEAADQAGDVVACAGSEFEARGESG